jgi:hypothetical protein
MMTHPSFLVWMPVALLWLVWGLLDSKQLKLAGLACVTAVLCCVPWTVRNFVVFHHFVPLRSNFGFELWRYNHGDGNQPLHPSHDAAEHAAFSFLGEYSYGQEKRQEALAWIVSHPRVSLRGTAERVMYFWFDFPQPLREFEQQPWFFRVKFLYIGPLLAMGIAGLITIGRKRHEYFWLLASFPAIFPLLYYITVAREFHRFPIDPILGILAACVFF